MKKENATNARDFDTVEEFVKNRLTAAQYERLHELLGITKNAVTNMFRHPRTHASIDNIKDLAKLTEVSAKFFVERYQMGLETIYISEAKEIGFVIS